MSNHRHGDVARELVQEARDDLLGHDVNVDGAATNLLIDAVEHDLIEQADHRTRDTTRLAALETQNRVLADAVIAITEAVHEAQPAILARQVQMLGSRDDPEGRQPRTTDDGSGPDSAHRR